MSYILDALKRADAQRERGQVPGLNAQPMPVAPASGSPRRLGLWLGALCGAAAVVAGALYWHSDSTQAATAPIPAPVPAPSPAPPGVVPAPVVAPAPLPSVQSVPQPPPPLPAPPVAKPVPPPAAPAIKPVPLQRREAASAAAAAPPPTLGELPEDIRRTVPKLVVSGSVYSSNPGQRILIVNGQVLNEGAVLAPDLVLESIGTKSAVLSVRGTRFRLDY
jgi:general secretion pathway protein B